MVAKGANFRWRTCWRSSSTNSATKMAGTLGALGIVADWNVPSLGDLVLQPVEHARVEHHPCHALRPYGHNIGGFLFRADTAGMPNEEHFVVRFGSIGVPLAIIVERRRVCQRLLLPTARPDTLIINKSVGHGHHPIVAAKST